MAEGLLIDQERENVRKMWADGASEKDIRSYLSLQGLTLEDLDTTPTSEAEKKSTLGKYNYIPAAAVAGIVGLPNIIATVVGRESDRPITGYVPGRSASGKRAIYGDVPENRQPGFVERHTISPQEVMSSAESVMPITRAGTKIGKVGQDVVAGMLSGAPFGFGGGLKGMIEAGLGGAAGAGVSSSLDETKVPEWVKAGAAVLASMIVPAAKTFVGGVKKLGEPFTQAAQKQIVGKILNEAALSKTPRIEPSPAGGRPTLGEATNDPGLLSVQRTIEQTSGPHVQGEFQALKTENNEAMQRALSDIRGTGVPSTVTSFADTVKQASLMATARKTTEEVGRLRQMIYQSSTGQTTAQASTALRERLGKLLEDARGQEQTLWEAVDPTNTTLIDVNALRGDIKSYLDTLPKIDRDVALSPTVQNVVKTLDGFGGKDIMTPAVAPLKEITAIRSYLSRTIREAQNGGRWNEARMLNDLSDIVLDGIDNLSFGDPGMAARYGVARDFSFNLNERFTRGTMKKVLGLSDGEARTNPSETAGKFMFPGDRAADEMDKLLLTVGNDAESLQNLRDYTIADLAAYAGKRDGTIDPNKLIDWRNRHQAALTRVPDLANDINSITDQAATTTRAATFQRAVEDQINQMELSKFVGADPHIIVAKLMKSDNPAKTARNLLDQMATSPAAQDGLRATAIDVLGDMISSVQPDRAGREFLVAGKMAKFMNDNEAFYTELFKSQPGAIDRLKNVKKSLDMFARAERAGPRGGPDTAAKLFGDKWLDVVVGHWLSVPSRIAGTAAGVGAGGLVGHPFLGAFIGRAASSELLHSMYATPKDQIRRLLVDAIMDPKLGEALMLGVKEPVPASTMRRLAPYLGAIGQEVTQEPVRRSEGAR